MILLTVLYIINIIVIMGLIGYLIGSVTEMKWGLYWSFARAIIHKDYRGINWIKNHPIKIVDLFLALALFFIDMTLIGKLMESDILTRPVFTLALSPIAWGLVILYISLTNKRIRELKRQRTNH